MFVITRSGAQEPCRFDKITDRITSLAFGLNPEFCDPVRGARGHAPAHAARRGGRARRSQPVGRMPGFEAGRLPRRAARARWWWRRR
jgi:hypothetical protein